MKKIIVILLVLTLFTSCVATYPYYPVRTYRTRIYTPHIYRGYGGGYHYHGYGHRR